ncbi:MAG: hypothetical protein ACREQ9_12410, partial [Candidatus Binatia bacterium]
ALAGLLLWAGLSLVGVCATGRLFAHYFLQLLPPLCLVCALVLFVTIEPRNERDSKRIALILALVLSGWLLKAVDEPLSRTARILYHRYVVGTEHWGDEAAAVAAYLRPRLDRRDVLYVVDYEPILYYLLPARAPTRYLFSPFLTDERWRDVAPVDPAKELRAIFAQSPLYVVKSRERDSAFYEIVRGELDRSYLLETTIGRVELYRRRSG